jgi:hypothetical protein
VRKEEENDMAFRNTTIDKSPSLNPNKGELVEDLEAREIDKALT